MKLTLLEVGHWHVPLYLDAIARSGCEVVAVSDRNPDIAEAHARRFSCRAYASYHQLLDENAIDFAFAFGRHVDMPEIGNTLIDRHIPFAMEKPCGITAADVKVLRQRAEAEKLYVAVPFILRLSELAAEVRRSATNHRPRLHHASFRFIVGSPDRYVKSGNSWMLDPRLAGGGCTINVAGHFIDLFRLLTQAEVARVSGTVSRRGFDGEVEDYSAFLMATEDGVTGVVETGYTFPARRVEQREFSFSISTDAAYFRSCPEGMTVSKRTSDGSEEPALVRIGLDTDPYYGQFVSHVLEDLRETRPPLAGLVDAEAAMQVVDAVYRSAALGGRWLTVGLP